MSIAKDKIKLEQRIQNLEGWIAFYDMLTEKIKKEGKKQRHGGYSLVDCETGVLGMPSLSQIKPPENLEGNRTYIFERHVERATEEEIKILTLNSWKAELREQQAEFKKKLGEIGLL